MVSLSKLNFTCEADTRLRLSEAQCMAYILARWPRSVLRIRIWILPMGSSCCMAASSVVSHLCLRSSCSQVRVSGW